MPRVIETTVYEFDELNDKAKDRARAWYRELCAGDNDWSEPVIEDADRMACILGITITKDRGNKGEPMISWSGFSCQGDGASFVGSYEYAIGAPTRIREEASKDPELHAIADALNDIQQRYQN